MSVESWAPDLAAIAWLVIGYLAGAVPFGLLISRAYGYGDVRKIGSGNIGATNVLRTGSKAAAAMTLVCDALKGTLPVIAASQFSGEVQSIYAGFGAIAGHIYPFWLKFRGGKGVATYVGVLLGLSVASFAVFAITWLTTAFAFRRSSLAALLASLAVPTYAYFRESVQLTVAFVCLAIIVFLTHRQNISRLMRGEEPKIEVSRRRK